jgi:hypothetical protein
MCENGTRILHYENAYDINLTPLTVSKYAFSEPNEPFTITIILNHITTQSDYQIFNSYKMGNTTEVFDLIEQHKGVNAVDEWGHTLLMLATQKGDLQTVALLLNTRMPKVDVNKAKSVRFPFPPPPHTHTHTILFTSFLFSLHFTLLLLSEWIHSDLLCGSIAFHFHSESIAEKRSQSQRSLNPNRTHFQSLLPSPHPYLLRTLREALHCTSLVSWSKSSMPSCSLSTGQM